MKFLAALLLLSTTAFAETTCNDAIEKFFATYAPNTKELVVTGKYTEKSEKTGEYLACEAPVKKEAARLVMSVKPEKFNPGYGDGGAFWPFGNYPTVDQESDEHRSVNYFYCSANADGFSIDFSYSELGGWYKSKRYKLSVTKNSDDSYDYSLLDGNPSSDVVTCRGALSERAAK